MGDFDINLLRKNKMMLNYYETYSQVPFLVKKYMNLCFSHSLHQVIVEPTSTTMLTTTLIDHILTNSPEKEIQSGVILR